MTADQPTLADVERAADQHRRALAALGIDCAPLIIEKGSRTYGYQWGMVQTPDRAAPPIGRPELGFTARDAYDAVTSRTSILWDVRRALIDAGHTFAELPQDPASNAT